MYVSKVFNLPQLVHAFLLYLYAALLLPHSVVLLKLYLRSRSVPRYLTLELYLAAVDLDRASHIDRLAVGRP